MIPYINDEKYYEFLIIEKIVYHYSFTIEGHTGECLLSMGFPSILTKIDPLNPFTYSFESLKINWAKDNSNKSIEKKINLFISEKTGIVREENYTKYKD